MNEDNKYTEDIEEKVYVTEESESCNCQNNNTYGVMPPNLGLFSNISDIKGSIDDNSEKIDSIMNMEEKMSCCIDVLEQRLDNSNKSNAEYLGKLSEKVIKEKARLDDFCQLFESCKTKTMETIGQLDMKNEEKFSNLTEEIQKSNKYVDRQFKNLDKISKWFMGAFFFTWLAFFAAVIGYSIHMNAFNDKLNDVQNPPIPPEMQQQYINSSTEVLTNPNAIVVNSSDVNTHRETTDMIFEIENKSIIYESDSSNNKVARYYLIFEEDSIEVDKKTYEKLNVGDEIVLNVIRVYNEDGGLQKTILEYVN